MKKATKSGRITWKRFDRDFQFVKNHIDNNASFDGCAFETYGEELAFVKTMVDQNRVMTIVDADNDRTAVLPGFRLVNRINYLITEKPIEYDFWILYEKF